MRLLDRLGGIRERLGSIVTTVRARLPKTRRGKILLYGALAVVAMGSVGGLSVAVWSSFPSFCPSCHHVEPYYDSWGVSVHGKEDVTCTDCHFKPGLVPYAMGKANGMVEVVKYFSGAVPVKLRSEVQDVSCLRDGCHSIDELEAEPVEFGKVSFRHDKHREGLRGIHLRCASCHSTSLHSESDTVSTRKCYTCHFKIALTDEETGQLAPGSAGARLKAGQLAPGSAGARLKAGQLAPGSAGARLKAGETAEERELREKLTKCDTCHEVPKEITTHAGKTFDHEEYASDDDDCSRCHANVTRGDGAVAKDQCVTCHNEGLGHLDKYAEPEEVHEIHVTETQVACFECHNEVRHGVEGVAGFPADPPGRVVRTASWTRPGSFMVRAFGPAVELYGGSGGAGVEDLPDPMFATEVQCAGCHQERPGPPGVPEPELGGGDVPPAHKACVDCHEEGYDKLATRWELAFDGYVSKLAAAREKAASFGQVDPQAKKLLAETGRNIELVRDGRAVHNVRYAARCLRQAQAALVDILAPTEFKDAAVVMPTYEVGAHKCLDMCHIGVETIGTLSYADGDFLHREHVMSPRVQCSQCHSFDEERHKETSDRTRDCNACHHEEETVAGDNACRSCHPLQDAVYFGTVAGDPRARPAAMAAAKAAETGERVTCVSCHTGVSQGHSKRRLVQLCQDCHGGQKARARMLDEWQVGIRAELEHLEALIRRGKARLADGRGLSVGAASSAPRSRPDLRAASSAPRSRPDLRAAEALRKALATSVEAAEVVRQDKSFGAHNLDYLYSVLSEAAEGLTDALGAVGSTTLSPPRGEVGSTTLTSASSVEPSPPRGEIPLSAHARAFTPPSPSFGLGAASSGQRRGPDRAAERRRGQLTR